MGFLLLLPLVIVGAVGLPAPAGAGQQQQEQELGVFLSAVEMALMAPEPAAYAALVTASGDREADWLAREAWVPATSRVTVRERDRLPLEGALPDEGYRLMLEVLTERGRAARLATWRVDVRLTAATAGEDIRRWRIVGQERLSSLDGLHRLALDPAKQYAVRNFVVSSTDLRLELSSGSVFVAENEAGVTALVLRGRGQIRFAPAPRAERTQMRIFAGAESLVTSFDQAFIRLNPAEYENRVTAGSMEARSVNQRDLRRAQQYFDENVRKTYTLHLGDLTDETWVLTPSGEDLVAEVHTRRFDTLTYAQSANEPEDISLFDRKKRRNIASYASPERLESRGRFYDEDDQVEYDVLDYKIDARFDPEREWIEGLATVLLAVRAPATSTLTLRIDEGLTVRSVSSPPFGRLMHLRVVGQNNLIVNLPALVTRDTELELTVVYGGRLAAQSLEREAIAVEQDPQSPQFIELAIPAEPHWVYSNRVHWYPRSQVNDYATATLRLTVPEVFDCVATGFQAAGSPIRVEGDAASRGPRKIHVFIANQPVRYLSVVISRFVEVASGDVAGAAPSSPDARGSADAIGPAVKLSVVANPRQQSRGRSLNGTAADILRFYTSISARRPTRSSRSRSRRVSCQAATARPTSPCSISPCRPRRTAGGMIRSASTASRPSSWRTRSRISGGVRAWAGRTTTSSG